MAIQTVQPHRTQLSEGSHTWFNTLLPPFLKFLICDKRAQHFHFAQDPMNYVASSWFPNLFRPPKPTFPVPLFREKDLWVPGWPPQALIHQNAALWVGLASGRKQRNGKMWILFIFFVPQGSLFNIFCLKGESVSWSFSVFIHCILLEFGLPLSLNWEIQEG